MRLSKLALVVATIAVGSLQSAATAQESVISSGGNRTSFDISADRFSADMDSLGERMAQSYSQRQLAAAHAQRIANENEAYYLLGNQMAHQRAMDSMVLGRNPTDQGPYNQGNNQANNGYLPGNIFASPGLANSGLGGLWNGGLFPTQFGSLPFPGTFGSFPFGPFLPRPNAANSTSTFFRNGTFGFNGSGTATASSMNTGTGTGTGTPTTGTGTGVGTTNTTGSTNTVRNTTTTFSGRTFTF